MPITLKRYNVTALPAGVNQHAWPLRVEAESTIPGLGSEIFVYQSGSGDEFAGDVPVAVASVLQMVELPVNFPVLTPDADNRIVPFYRKSTYEFYCRTPEEVADLWDIIQQDVQDLVNNFELAKEAALQETVTISDTLTPLPL